MSSKPGLLLTGASGFVGRHVVALGRGRFDIVASGRGPRPEWLPADVAWCSVDLMDRASVAALPAEVPFVLHLASETVPSKFFSYDPLLDSVEMTLNLCRHLRAGRLLFASSCLVYAASTAPLREEDPVDPRGHYGLTKLLCEAVVSRTGDAGALETAIARPFNHVGAGMRPDLAIPSIARRVRAAPEGAMIEMAGLDSVRDFLDVSDIVEAYFAILEMPALPQRIFNVASGKASSIGDVVRTLARILNKPISGITFADQGNSADDTSIVVGNSDKLRQATGWSPKKSLEDALSGLVT